LFKAVKLRIFMHYIHEGN